MDTEKEIENKATPEHIDDRAPGLVVQEVAYATQEEIIDMVNAGLLKVTPKEKEVTNDSENQ